jgi:aspartate aminotransferase-like enzyme
VTIVHNETSTGVTSPIRDIARSIREIPGGEDIMILVDSVSGLAGIKVEVDAWDLDVVLTSSQKAFALPPGLSFCSVSDKAMDKARSVDDRGYYFDFLELDRYLLRDQTPYTPPISLLFALDMQLSHILEEGLRERFIRHITMRDMTLIWAGKHGFGNFAAPGYESPTVSCLNAVPAVDIRELIDFARSQNMVISNGYGPLKGKSFRIAHMGDTTLNDISELLSVLDEFVLNSDQR